MHAPLLLHAENANNLQTKIYGVLDAFLYFCSKIKKNIFIMDLHPIIDLFERWLSGDNLSEDETMLIILYIIMGVLIIAIIILMIITAHVGRFWMYTRWFFEDIWYWIRSVYRKIFNIEEDFTEDE